MDFCESVVANIKQEGGGGHGGSTLGVGGQQLVVALGGFTCTLCSKRLASMEQYKRHMEWHSKRTVNKESKVVVCPICSEVRKPLYDITLQFIPCSYTGSLLTQVSLETG